MPLAVLAIGLAEQASLLQRLFLNLAGKPAPGCPNQEERLLVATGITFPEPPAGEPCERPAPITRSGGRQHPAQHPVQSLVHSGVWL